MDPISLRRRDRRLPAVLVCLGLLLLGLLFVPECDDCYFVYWRFDSLADWLLTRPSPPIGVSEDVIVGVPENGRYLGNLLGVLQGKLYFVPWAGPLLRGALMGGALCALVFLLSRWTRRGPVGSGEALALAFALVLLAPRGVWQEGFSWGAGLVNYLLPMLGLLFLSTRLARKEPKPWLPAGLLAFLCALFLETATICLAAAGALAAFLLRDGPRKKEGRALWLGSWLGALVMFTASGYRTGTNADRRVDPSLLLDHLKTIAAETAVFPWAAALAISLLLVWLVRRRTRGIWKPAVFLLVPLHLAQLWLAWENLLGRPRYGLPALGVALALVLVWCFLLLQTEESAPIWALVLAAGLFAGPLLFVTPIGARNFLPTYVILCWIALLLYGQAREKGLPPLTRLAVPLSALALTGLLAVYGCNCLAYHQRLDYGQAQAEAGAESLTLPLLPFSQWAINETVWKGDLSYLIYREVPWDVALSFVPWEECPLP